MGGCCSKRNNSATDVELSTVKNEAMKVKCGLHGKDIKVTMNGDKHSYLVQGTGTVLGIFVIVFECRIDYHLRYPALH